MKYYARHIGDYNNDAGHLSLLEHGVYARLLDVYYTKESGIPDDQKYRWLGARTEEERAAVDSVLQEFFTLENGAWVQDRCEREIEAHHARTEMARSNGKFGGRPRRANENRTETNPVFSENPAETKSVSGENPEETDPVFFENPEETEPFHFENPNKTGSKANHKPLTINHKPLTINNSGLTPVDPWWMDHPDGTARELVEIIRSSKGYADDVPEERAVTALLEFARGFAPDDQTILNLAHQFAERASRKRKREYANPVTALRNWISRAEDSWRRIRRERERDASKNGYAKPLVASRPSVGGHDI